MPDDAPLMSIDLSVRSTTQFTFLVDDRWSIHVLVRVGVVIARLDPAHQPLS